MYVESRIKLIFHLDSNIFSCYLGCAEIQKPIPSTAVLRVPPLDTAISGKSPSHQSSRSIHAFPPPYPAYLISSSTHSPPALPIPKPLTRISLSSSNPPPALSQTPHLPLDSFEQPKPSPPSLRFESDNHHRPAHTAPPMTKFRTRASNLDAHSSPCLNHG